MPVARHSLDAIHLCTSCSVLGGLLYSGWASLSYICAVNLADGGPVTVAADSITLHGSKFQVLLRDA